MVPVSAACVGLTSLFAQNLCISIGRLNTGFWLQTTLDPTAKRQPYTKYISFCWHSSISHTKRRRDSHWSYVDRRLSSMAYPSSDDGTMGNIGPLSMTDQACCLWARHLFTAEQGS